MSRWKVSPVEKELAFGAWCRTNRIDLCLLDLDDTISATRGIFWRKIDETCSLIHSIKPEEPEENIKSILTEINNRLFETRSVNPKRWEEVIKEVGDKFQLEEIIREAALKKMMEIYTTPLPFLPGAETGLRFLKKTGIETGIVTHANRQWTAEKFKWLQLSRFLPWDNVFIVDENEHKNPEWWAKAVKYFQRIPENCAVFGDSPRADINPAEIIGVRHRFLVGGDVWSVHQEKVSPSTKRIKDLMEIEDLGINLVKLRIA